MDVRAMVTEWLRSAISVLMQCCSCSGDTVCMQCMLARHVLATL